jgi:hypothetical protein
MFLSTTKIVEPISLLHHRRSLKAEEEETHKTFAILQFSININVSVFQEKLKLNYNFTHYLVWMQNVCNLDR